MNGPPISRASRRDRRTYLSRDESRERISPGINPEKTETNLQKGFYVPAPRRGCGSDLMFPISVNEDSGRDRRASAHAARNTTTGSRVRAAAESDEAISACRRVLVVDDAPDVTEMIATLIRFAGYEVTTALSATEAF